MLHFGSLKVMEEVFEYLVKITVISVTRSINESSISVIWVAFLQIILLSSN